MAQCTLRNDTWRNSPLPPPHARVQDRPLGGGEGLRRVQGGERAAGRAAGEGFRVGNTVFYIELSTPLT